MKLGNLLSLNIKKRIVKTDHNMLLLEVNLSYHIKKEHERVEMFNLRNKICQQQFKEYTSKSNILTKCFLSDETIDKQFERWQKQFRKSLYACFKKIRFSDKKKQIANIDVLMKEKRTILKETNHDKKSHGCVQMVIY